MPPSIMQALGHELRWQLAALLRDSDLKVGELTTATGEAQNLVSYHLRVLRDAGLVRERRSSADSRDIYYTLDRRAITDGLLGALVEITAGRRLTASIASKKLPAAGGMTSVLFLCTGNSARSQIAEAMLRRLGRQRLLVRSAGTHPAGVHPRVYTVLGARGIRVGSLRSKSVAEFAGQPFNYVITLCDIARTELIEFVGKPRLVHWSIADPAAPRGGNGATVAAAFHQAAEAIEARVEDFYAELLASPKAA